MPSEELFVETDPLFASVDALRPIELLTGHRNPVARRAVARWSAPRRPYLACIAEPAPSRSRGLKCFASARTPFAGRFPDANREQHVCVSTTTGSQSFP